MLTIYKYPLEIKDRQYVELPLGSEILNIQFQGNALCLWAIVDPEKTKEIRVILLYGTGHKIEENGFGHKYLTTVQEGAFVWHFFERITVHH